MALALASFALLPHAGSPFTVTFRLGGQVIGPAAAVGVVLPTADGAPAAQQRGTAGGGPGASRVAEIWVTMPASPITQRLAELARAAASGHRLTGSCEIDAASAGGTIVRRYDVAGCYAKRVDVLGDSRRVALGYTDITHS